MNHQLLLDEDLTLLAKVPKQVPEFKVIRHMLDAQGRQAAVVNIDFGPGLKPAHLTMFFSRGDNIRSLKVFWESVEEAHAEFEQGMGINQGSGRDTADERCAVGDGDGAPQADGDSR